MFYFKTIKLGGEQNYFGLVILFEHLLYASNYTSFEVYKNNQLQSLSVRVFILIQLIWCQLGVMQFSFWHLTTRVSTYLTG